MVMARSRLLQTNLPIVRSQPPQWRSLETARNITNAGSICSKKEKTELWPLILFVVLILPIILIGVTI